MFVTSRRMWARLSRVLVVILLAVLLAWGMVYLQNNRTKDSAKGSDGGPATKPVALSAVSVGQAAPGSLSTSQNGGSSSGGSAEKNIVQLPPLMPVGGDKPRTPANSTNLVATPPMGTLPPTTSIPARAAIPPTSVANPLSAGEADGLLAQARTKYDAGDYLGVRNVLNDAIVADRFPAAQADLARGYQSRVNEKLVFSPQSFAGDTYSDVTKIERSDGLLAIARSHAIPWEFVCRVNGTNDKRIRLGQTLKSPIGPFHAMVSKSAFRIDLFLGGLPGEPGSLYVTSLAVGLGKDNSTPTGQWDVVQKTRNPPWTNPRSREHFEGYDPKNPLGGYWIALKGVDGDAVGKSGYGIHGTIDPDSIGKQASMGCVRLRVEDIQLVFDMLNGKSRVLVRD